MEHVKNDNLSIQEELSTSEYPYDKCILCLNRDAKRCDGPNPYALKGERRVDFLRKLQKSNRETYRNGASWSYEYIASKTEGVSKATVVRIMTDENYDPGTFSYGEVFRVLFDSSIGVYPCGIHSEEKEIVYVDSPETLKELKRLQQDNINLISTLEQLRANIGKTHEFQKEVIDGVREDTEKRVAELRDMYERHIASLKKQLKDSQDSNDKLWDQIARKDDYIDRVGKKAGL